MGVFKNQGYNL